MARTKHNGGTRATLLRIGRGFARTLAATRLFLAPMLRLAPTDISLERICEPSFSLESHLVFVLFHESLIAALGPSVRAHLI